MTIVTPKIAARTDSGKHPGPTYLRRLRASPRWLAPTLLLLTPLGALAVGPLLWPVDPVGQDLLSRLQGPSGAHPLGTDALGRDMLSRVLHGGRISIGVSVGVTAATGLIGIAVGSLAASQYRRRIDTLLMRTVEVLLAFPFLLVALTVAGLFGSGVGGIVVAITLFGWVTHAVVARGEILRVRGALFVEAARAVGASPLRVYFRHVLPDAGPALIVVTVVRFAHVIIAIAGLSFLGVGVQPPTPEWGALLNEGLPFFERAPHLLFAPGLAVTLSSLAVTFVAEDLRRWLNPMERARRR